MKKPIVLTIMDGYGLSDSREGNAIFAADTPNLDRLFKECPNIAIAASGLDVGLPKGQMGNSEVGHTNIGAGRVVFQKFTLISNLIDDGTFFLNPVLLSCIENCKQNNSALHLLGLISDGGVHSHNTHLYALLKMAKDNGLSKVFVHCLMDGRDVPPTSGAEFIVELQEKMAEIGVGEIATISGRYYGMDRDTQWDRVEKCYAAMVYGEGIRHDDPVASMYESYEKTDENGKNITDEFIIPTVFCDNACVCENDSVIFFNFRPDRAREITRAFVDENFKGFETQRKNASVLPGECKHSSAGFFPTHFVCFTEYDATMPNVHIAFDSKTVEIKDLTMTLGEVLSKHGKTQLRIAETTKYAHVTFFFNGGEEVMFPGEDRELIKTPEVATFDMMPEMSAYPVCEKAVEMIKSGKYDVIILNFANCDMVGHTGIFSAAKKAVEVVDECVGLVVKETLSMGGVCLITGDHGNADKMTDDNGEPFTAHTTNKVPFIVVGYDCALTKEKGRLCDIAPTVLKIMGIEQPAQMDGKSLIV